MRFIFVINRICFALGFHKRFLVRTRGRYKDIPVRYGVSLDLCGDGAYTEYVRHGISLKRFHIARFSDVISVCVDFKSPRSYVVGKTRQIVVRSVGYGGALVSRILIILALKIVVNRVCERLTVINRVYKLLRFIGGFCSVGIVGEIIILDSDKVIILAVIVILFKNFGYALVGGVVFFRFLCLALFIYVRDGVLFENRFKRVLAEALAVILFKILCKSDSVLFSLRSERVERFGDVSLILIVGELNALALGFLVNGIYVSHLFYGSVAYRIGTYRTVLNVLIVVRIIVEIIEIEFARGVLVVVYRHDRLVRFNARRRRTLRNPYYRAKSRHDYRKHYGKRNDKSGFLLFRFFAGVLRF